MPKNILKITLLLLAAIFILIPAQTSFAMTLNPIRTIKPITVLPLKPSLDLLPETPLKLLMAPSNLKLSITENLAGGPNGQTLSWTDNSSNEDGFVLEGSADSLTFSDVVQLPSNTTTVQVTPEPNSVWTYRIRAISGLERSSPSNSCTAEGMPSIPTDLTVRPGTAPGNSINLHWETAGTSTPSTDWVIRRTSGSSEQYFTSSTNYYTDTTAQANTPYSYAVQSMSYGGRTAFCTPVALTVLAAPSNLTAVFNPGTNGISKLSVSWKDNSNNEDGFSLSQMTPDNNPNIIDLPANTTHMDLLINDSISYRLTVQAYSKNGNRSSLSEIYTWSPPVEKTVPPAPGNLTARSSWTYSNGGKTTQSATELEFTESFLQITRYIVEAREGNGPYLVVPKENLTQTALHKIQYTGMKAGAKYTFRIKAVNTYGESPYSADSKDITSGSSILGEPPVAPLVGAEGSKKSISFNLGSSKMFVDGISQSIDAGKDTQPIISESGRTLIPIRSMIENLGGTVEWLVSENKVLIELNGKKVALIIGKSEAHVNGLPVITDEPAQIINGRTMLPIRFVSENLGLKVDWNPVDKSILITE